MWENHCLLLCGPDSHSHQPREFGSGWAPFPPLFPSSSSLAMTRPGSSPGEVGWAVWPGCGWEIKKPELLGTWLIWLPPQVSGLLHLPSLPSSCHARPPYAGVLCLLPLMSHKPSASRDNSIKWAPFGSGSRCSVKMRLYAKNLFLSFPKGVFSSQVGNSHGGNEEFMNFRNSKMPQVVKCPLLYVPGKEKK